MSGHGRAATAFLLAGLVLGTGGCPSGPLDEAAIRKREAAELAARLHAWKVTLYRVAKTSVRALPPRDMLRDLAGDRKELTRAEWLALLEKEPSAAAHRRRVGFFIVGAQLREAAGKGALVAVAIVAAKGGGRLAGPADDRQLPHTGLPFDSPVTFYSECKDILADDEDNYPTFVVALLPAELAQAAREKKDPFAKPPFDRVIAPAFEHFVLGGAWLAVEPDIALYELHRSKSGELSSIEDGLVRSGRTMLYLQHKWSYHALDELAAIEKRLPEVGEDVKRLDSHVKSGDVERALGGFVHLLRSQCWADLGKKEESRKELELAQRLFETKGESTESGRMRCLPFALAAKFALDRGEYKKCAEQLRLAAAAIPGDPKEQAELLAMAGRIEKELPDSNSVTDILRFAARLLHRDIQATFVSPNLSQWAEGFRDRTAEQVKAWEKTYAPTADVESKTRELWSRLGHGVAVVTSRS